MALGAVVEPERAGLVLASSHEVEVARRDEVGHSQGNGRQQLAGMAPWRGSNDAPASNLFGSFDPAEGGVARQHGIESLDVLDRKRTGTAGLDVRDNAAEPLAQRDCFLCDLIELNGRPCEPGGCARCRYVRRLY